MTAIGVKVGRRELVAGVGEGVGNKRLEATNRRTEERSPSLGTCSTQLRPEEWISCVVMANASSAVL